MASPRAGPRLFAEHPHRTFLALSLPVMASLVAEPLAGVVDTAFVERLGAAPAAGLGAATALLSSAIWVFNFLGVGTQTEVAQARGQDDSGRAQQAGSLALVMSLALGIGFALLALAPLSPVSEWMSTDPGVRASTEDYLRIRLLGAPAMLVGIAAFGALRGLHDMRTPLWIAAFQSAINILLDPLLIFGAGVIPPLGVAGAAWATVISQMVGACWAVEAVRRGLGLTTELSWRRARHLLVVGRDMVLRTSALLAFMLFATRAALQAGAEAGAAHQALRQIWVLLAFLLDAYATAAQSLIGYFVGSRRREPARRVAQIACGWGLTTGLGLCILLLALERPVMLLLVPPEATAWFRSAWWVCALSQPLNALSFATDGIHWGTGDYRYLRNGMLLSSACGLAALMSIDPEASNALQQVWLATTLWISVRAGIGLARIWPGLGASPLRR